MLSRPDAKPNFLSCQLVALVDNYGFKPSELKMIESIIEDNEEVIAEHWNKYFNN